MEGKHATSTALVAKEPTDPEKHLETAAHLSHSIQEAVFEELRRLITSSRFNSSHRCQALLRYVVENAIKGNAGSLKERSIGIEVFGRDSDYDTSTDPVVRMAAGEVRKKLAQYYYDPENTSKIRIELPPGSYVPVFSSSDALPHTGDLGTAKPLAGTGAYAENFAGTSAQVAQGERFLRWATWLLVAGFLVAVVSVLFFRQSRPEPPDAFKSFWAPVVNSPNQVLLCVGHRMLTQSNWDSDGEHGISTASKKPGASDERRIWPVVTLRDAITLANIAALLRADNKAFSIRGEDLTAFEDLQKGPVVLLGAFNNDWTMRLTESMRFHFTKDPDNLTRWIADRQRPDVRIGGIQNDSEDSTKVDYALVARVFDPDTRQPTIIVAGVSAAATHAAGDFITNSAYLDDFSKKAPQNWQTKNMELLIVANSVNGDSGPPSVAASYFW